MMTCQTEDMDVSALTKLVESNTVYGFAGGEVDCMYDSPKEFVEAQCVIWEMFEPAYAFTGYDDALGGFCYTPVTTKYLESNQGVYRPPEFVRSVVLGLQEYTLLKASAFIKKFELPHHVEFVYVSDGADEIVYELKALHLHDRQRTYGEYAFGRPVRTSYVAPRQLNTLGDVTLWTETIPKGMFSTSIISRLFLREGLLHIAEQAFASCTLPQIVELPESLQTIGTKAFQQAKGVQVIKLPDNVELGKECFSYSTLTHVILPKGVTFTGEKVFQACSALKEVSLGECDSLPVGAFELCKELSKVHGFENIKNFEYWCFKGCTALTELPFGEGIKCISERAFQETGVSEVFIHFENAVIGDAVFLGCQSLKHVRFSGTLASCGNDLFVSCTMLQTVDMGDLQVENGPKYALFEYCKNLRRVIFPHTMRYMYESILADLADLPCVVRLPKTIVVDFIMYDIDLIETTAYSDIQYWWDAKHIPTTGVLVDVLTNGQSMATYGIKDISQHEQKVKTVPKAVFECYRGTLGEIWCRHRGVNYRYVEE